MQSSPGKSMLEGRTIQTLEQYSVCLIVFGLEGCSLAIFARELPIFTVTEEIPVTKLIAPGSWAELQQQPIESQSEKHYTCTHKNHAERFTIAISLTPQDSPVR